MSPTTSSFLDDVLTLAAREWRVFPVRPKEKTPQIEEWQIHATTNVEQIQKWWTQYPTANVGIATGEGSNLLVLDIDVDEEKGTDGETSLVELEQLHGVLPHTTEVHTPRGGRHLYFQYPSGQNIRNSAGLLGSGLDIRAEGGYVVGSPSVLLNGLLYAWDVDHHPDDTPLAVIPQWVLVLLREQKPKVARSLDVNGNGQIPEGQRHAWLASLAGTLLKRGVSESVLLAALQATNTHEFESPLSIEEVEKQAHKLFVAYGTKRDRLCSPAENVEAPSVVLTSAATIKPLTTDWAWEGLIPLNALTVIAGNPGYGKSTITTEKAAQWSRGLAEGNLKGRPIDIVIASAEDSPAHTLVPRLTAAGADLNRIHFIGMNRNGTEDTISLPEDVPAITQAMKSQCARVLIIDPLACHINGAINSWRDTDIRQALSPLAELAEELEAVVLVVVHLNKGNHQEVLHRVSGSTGIVAAARSVLLVAEDPEDENIRVLTHMKCNLAPKAVSQRYTIEERIVSVDGNDIKTSAIVWGDVAPELTAFSVLNVKKDAEEQSATKEAMDWLEGYLEALPLNAKDLYKEARKLGISERTLNRAKKALGVVVRKNGFGKDGVWTWQLPEKGAKDCQYPQPGNLSGSPHEKSSFSKSLAKGCQQHDIGNHSRTLGNVSDEQEETIYVD